MAKVWPEPVGSCGCRRPALQAAASSSPARPCSADGWSNVSQNAAASRPQPGAPFSVTAPPGLAGGSTAEPLEPPTLPGAPAAARTSGASGVAPEPGSPAEPAGPGEAEPAHPSA